MTPLIKRRHEGPGWSVFFEVANGTGAKATRRADAVAVGLWPSNKYEVHGYEVKDSRQDVRRELLDPSKSDGVGKYCDYWWLVVSDLKLTNGLMIPSQWGILYPKANVLRVHRKATKRRAKPVDRPFFAVLVRNATENSIPRTEHQAYMEGEHVRLTAARQQERDRLAKHGDSRVKELNAIIDEFSAASGINLREGGGFYGARHIGEAAKVVKELLDLEKRQGWFTREHDKLAGYYRSLSEGITSVMDAMVHLTALRQTLPVSPSDDAFRGSLAGGPIFFCKACGGHAARSVAGRCPHCAAEIAPAALEQGGQEHRGELGAPEQDAGVQLRDQREALPDGEPPAADPGLGV